MRKLNQKGFTLVELLATIVVLALVIGVAVPITTTIVSNSKHKALGVMVDNAETFIADQWRIKKTDPDSVTDAFKDIMGDYEVSDVEDRENVNWVTLDVNNENDKTLIEEMGIPSEDVTTVDIMIDKNNIPCVVISSIPSNSGIYNSIYWDKVPLDEDKVVIPLLSNDRYYSKCCIAGLAHDARNLHVEEE